jgi:hypothetical protein
MLMIFTVLSDSILTTFPCPNTCSASAFFKDLEKFSSSGWMHLATSALSPHQTRPSEVWRVYDGTAFVAMAEAQVRCPLPSKGDY